jgi:hypothetical protein
MVSFKPYLTIIISKNINTILKNGEQFNVNPKTTFLYKESIVYPFVNVQEKKGGKLFIDNQELTNIIIYVQETGMSSL